MEKTAAKCFSFAKRKISRLQIHYTIKYITPSNTLHHQIHYTIKYITP
jgi:hypothetical protein